MGKKILFASKCVRQFQHTKKISFTEYQLQNKITLGLNVSLKPSLTNGASDSNTSDNNGSNGNSGSPSISTFKENIPCSFADAELVQKENGDIASLHIMLFDEIDTICTQRGSTSIGIANRLLSEVDGVNSWHNVVIGMINRKDLLDDSLLLDEEGKQRICSIYLHIVITKMVF